MTLREKLQKAWDNRAQIAEGLWNEYISSSQEIEQEKERRREICRQCEYYDPTGTKEIVVVKNEPACLLCGCNITLLTASMSVTCSAPKIGLKPRWREMMTPEQEKQIKETEYQNQFKQQQ